MKLSHSLLAAACLLALAACGKNEAPVETTSTPSAPAAAEAAPAEAAVTAAEAAPAETAAPAAAGECAFNLEGNDAMQFNVRNIDVPSTCTQFTIHLKHTGTMPVAAMGHNVVIAKSSDMNAIAADGASVQPDHIKAGDTRVVAHSSMVGGGQTTEVTFEVAKIAAGGYSFFCTFPGHSAMMNGTLTVK